MQAGLAQTALWMQDAEQVFAEVLDLWRPRVQRVDGALSLQALQGVSPALQRLILRDWLQGGASLPPPRTLIQGLQQWVQQPLRADAYRFTEFRPLAIPPNIHSKFIHTLAQFNVFPHANKVEGFLRPQIKLKLCCRHIIICSPITEPLSVEHFGRRKLFIIATHIACLCFCACSQVNGEGLPQPVAKLAQ